MLASYTDARGKEYDFTYTTYGNLETIADPLSNLTTLDYHDEMGKLKSITNALNFTTSYSYGDGCVCSPLESQRRMAWSCTSIRNRSRV